MAIVIITLITIGVTSDLAAQKTDTIILDNGSVVIGEIVQMSYNTLTLKTTPMRTIQIKWYTVDYIISPNKVFVIETQTGRTVKDIIYGSIDSAGTPGHLAITSTSGVTMYHRSEIATIYQIKNKFFSKFSGNIGLGASYTKSSNILQLNYDGNLSYQGPKFLSRLNFSSIVTQQQDTIVTTKTDVTLNSYYFLSAQWSVTNYLGYNRNSELGINRRLYIGVGAALQALSKKNMSMILSAGGLRTFERSEAGSTSDNYEGTLQADYRIYKNTSPEINLTNTVKYYPNFTDWGRNRIEVELNANVEIITNLYLGPNVYYNYDSRPSEGATSTDDYGIVLKLTYKFGLTQ